ncbi:6-phospho-beta-glucosidase [Clostridium frigidicarnis]|uniref:6-phospho-beta-glucosidase n=1 Tax=Clostridium frigidicarnis TaxID=84698 RepID=A0A1I0YIV5_9CLOT|nr:6-phospho-beta-glucosidase [Clostridium frigidicarnis]SFB13375.1 6-phospho-beta-glucosidase [Clostridium frigidicarnis]
MKELKVTVIGGGSSYTPELINGFLMRKNELPVKEVVLVDIEDGKEKVNTVSKLAERMVKKAGLKTKITVSFNRKEALKNSDFVVTQFRVGGLEARAKDERFPLKYNVIGQETCGPGGFAKALRTIPVILDICRDIEEVCPEAWLINFTNPSGMVTEAVNKYSNVKCIGLCNVPIHMKMDFAKALGVSSEELFVEFIGLNHLVWAKSVWLKGKDITQDAIEAMTDKESLSMKNIPAIPWDRDYLKAVGMIPSPYHRYYLMTADMVEEEKEAASEGGKGTRAEIVQGVEAKLFDIYKDENVDVKPKELENRGGAYYSDAAVSLISAIFNDKKEIHTVNVLNNGIIKALPDNCIIETNAIVDNTGATPVLLKSPLDEEAVGLIHSVKSYEIATVDAAANGDKEKALVALVNNPLIPSIDISKKLLEELLEINKPYLPQFN